MVKLLNKSGIKEATEIQEESIELVLDKKDIIAEAPTGTGKTLAFLLPIINDLNPDNDGIQTLIISPTRELALQITEEAEKLNYKSLNIMTIYGGRAYKQQLEETKGKLDLVVATPGRLLDFIKQGLIKLNNLKTLVIDEADQILLMGFRNEIEEIMKVANKKRQTLCYSATMNSQVKKLAYRITQDASFIKVSAKRHKESIKKYLIETSDREKIDALCTVLNKENPFMAIIFCRTKARVNKLEAKLEERNYIVQKIHSDVPQVKREKIIKSFRDGDIQYLIATDVASRGLDIKGVSHIFNYDVPEKAETYIHRIGRTARAGEEGETYLFSVPKDERVLNEIKGLLEGGIEILSCEPEKDVLNTNEVFKGKYNKKIKTRTQTKK